MVGRPPARTAAERRRATPLAARVDRHPGRCYSAPESTWEPTRVADQARRAGPLTLAAFGVSSRARPDDSAAARSADPGARHGPPGRAPVAGAPRSTTG